MIVYVRLKYFSLTFCHIGLLQKSHMSFDVLNVILVLRNRSDLPCHEEEGFVYGVLNNSARIDEAVRD